MQEMKAGKTTGKIVPKIWYSFHRFCTLDETEVETFLSLHRHPWTLVLWGIDCWKKLLNICHESVPILITDFETSCFSCISEPRKWKWPPYLWFWFCELAKFSSWFLVGNSYRYASARADVDDWFPGSSMSCEWADREMNFKYLVVTFIWLTYLGLGRRTCT